MNRLTMQGSSREVRMVAMTFHEIEREAWSKRAADYDSLFAAVAEQAIGPVLDSVEPLQGKRHLDVASGTGHLVAAASRRGADSIGVDFAGAMVAMALKSHPHERYRVADAQDLPFDDEAFDAVTCAFGFSHMQEPQAAVTEAFRVLKPGGRLAFTLWFGGENGNEMELIMQEALAAHASADRSLPREWTCMRLADPAACGAITALAGFAAPVFRRLPITWRTASTQSVVDIVGRLSIRTRMVIDGQPPEARQRIYGQIHREAEARRSNGIISLAWPALLTVVQKPVRQQGGLS